MIRIVLAVALSTALLGIALPSAERADGDRSAALATAELERTAETAARLAAENDPVETTETPAATTLTLVPPEPTFDEGDGRFRIVDDELRWEPPSGRSESVVPSVPIRVEEPIVAAERTRVRLTLVRLDGDSVVRIAPVNAAYAPLDRSHYGRP